MLKDQLKPNVVIRGPIFPEPVQVIATVPMGEAIKLIGKGLKTGQVHEPILNGALLAALEASPETEPFDGDPQKFRLGVEALRLALAYEHDPYFSLSIFPANQLERMIRDMYARNLTEEVIKNRIIEEVDQERLRRITNSTLEGLAKRALNLGALIGKSAEARERRLVPEVVEDFFVQAGPIAGVHPKEVRPGSHFYL